MEPARSDTQQDDKMVWIEMEYSQLLQSHLSMFEREMSDLKLHNRTHLENIEKSHKEQLQHLHKEVNALRTSVQSSEREKSKAQSQAKSLQQRINTLLKQNEELTELNKSLAANQHDWASRVAELERKEADKDKRIEELESEMRDIMFHLEAQEKVRGNSDMQQGDLVTATAPQPTRASRRGHH
eukprot:TRINITY_DN10198_c0_g2_i3.p1 TRINITY_DN10198_c0_g2~~TRINITY_DN10198_c0_g2_i3.p1  ORF type:complete len:203 (-),score=54.20 TRINITY_DN10198_c0_g2_i3:87-638(-)